jgi:hypothetical protein
MKNVSTATKAPACGALDVALAELGAEPLQQPDLLVGPLELALAGRLLQAQQPFVLGQEAVALPDAADTARGDLDPAQHQLLGDPHRPVAGMGKGVVEDRLLDRGADPVGVRRAGAGDPVEQALSAVGLEVPAYLVELLARVAHHPASFAHVAEFRGELEQAALTPCYFLLRGHVDLRIGWMKRQLHPVPASGAAWPRSAR